MSTNRENGRILMLVQSHEKLTIALNAYQTWHNKFEVLIKEQKIPSIGAMGVVRPKEEIW